MRVIIAIAFLVCVNLLSALNSHGQVCGAGSTVVTVRNPEGKSIPRLTVELIPEIPYQEYDDYLQDQVAIKVHSVWGTAVKLSVENAEAIVKRDTPISKYLYCESQLKRPASAAKAPSDSKDKAGVMHFRFCTTENSLGVFLLKISAPGYTTDYYAGRFLLGCGSLYEFTLSRKEKTKKAKHLSWSKHASIAGAAEPRNVGVGPERRERVC